MAIAKRNIQTVVAGQAHFLNFHVRMNRPGNDSQWIPRGISYFQALGARTLFSKRVYGKDRLMVVVPDNSEFNISDSFNFRGCVQFKRDSIKTFGKAD